MDLSEIAKQLERIADALEQQNFAAYAVDADGNYSEDFYQILIENRVREEREANARLELERFDKDGS